MSPLAMPMCFSNTLMTTPARRAQRTETDEPDPSIVAIRRYRVREDDLASNRYRFLGMSKWKPPVMTTVSIGRLCELTAMLALPGVTLGGDVAVHHKEPVIRGAVITVTVTCTPRDGGWWECEATITANKVTVANCELWFLAEVDRERYHKGKLAPLFAARGRRVALWLCLLSGLSLLGLLAMPIQLAYLSRHVWASRAVEPALAAVWFMARKGFLVAIKDWFTVRPVFRWRKAKAVKIPLPRKAK